MTLETLITLLTIENDIIKNYFVIMNRPAIGTTFSILEMFSVTDIIYELYFTKEKKEGKFFLKKSKDKIYYTLCNRVRCIFTGFSGKIVSF